MLWKTSVGSVTLYALEDGYSIRDPHEFFLGSTPDAWEGHEEHLREDGRMYNSYGCFLVDDGSRKILIDTGFGVNAPEMPNGEGGWLPGALESLGVSPGDVSDVVFTHLHPDHLLGSVDTDYRPFYPNATAWTLEREAAYWQSGVDDRGPIVKPAVDGLEEAGVLSRVAAAGEILPGITMVETFGHTPGHTSILVRSGEEAVMISGDLWHSPMQTIHTDWNIGFDIDKPMTAATRKRFFEDLERSGIPVAGGHLYRPGFGRIVSESGVLTFSPLPVTELG